MRMCMPHWNALKAAIDARGLSQFIAKDGDEVQRRADTKSFEPLLGAHNAILAQAINVGGLEVLMQNDDGQELCPICFFQDRCKCGAPDCKERYEKWIEFSAEDARREAIHLGLLPVA
jgi:hypothetical protein